MQVFQYCFHLFLIATFVSFEVLRNQSSRKLDEFYHNIHVTMKSFNISVQLRERVWRYIKLQREVSDMYFLIAESTFRCLPRDLYIMTCGIKIGHIIKNQPLFFEFSDYMMAHIATVATLHLFPATEVMKYAGEVCTEIHILIAGYCTMKLQDGRSKVVEPGECLYVLEATLNIPSLVTVIALTNCKIVTIKYQNFKAILLHYSIDYESLQFTVKTFPYWAAVKKLQRHHHHAKREIVEISNAQPNVFCFGYRMKKRRVAVVGADGNRLTTLHVGSVFGNLDNCPLGRRTLKMVASGHVEWMAAENVSQPLSERLGNYLNLLWETTKGTQYPMLLNEAPYYLKEAVLNSLFGSNLVNHPALRHCHKDMIRQMTFCLRTLVFFAGDVIVYVGDIDNCMYFIQQGEVQAISEDTMSSEVVVKVLRSGEMFSFHQGLYERCGHEYTYKVTTYTVITYLNRESWSYLLDFFPASKYLIYKYAEENPIG
ncbi:voltage and ligand gated potassium channel [Holotrichia oblita]|uniref:Voltage and ligand gated potassium channel n=2 Tax=Holotrichia oblita TaxID=644536 RepID=A0ACB9SLV3_HOLOL|nr:voltage and ligand gated potassium channel [Holotrichia oblita]KAI4456102.1 voltage and ligand gated potassium channel [Holotrichia oblita]